MAEDELADEEGAVLPAREMMSLISTDPIESFAGVDAPSDGGPVVQPPRGDEMHDDAS